MACHSATETFSSGFADWPRTPPATYTRTSISPSRPADDTSRSIDAGSVTSIAAAWMMPSPAVGPANRSTSSARRSQAHTCAPRSANASAMARPMPRAAPATMTRRFGKVMSTTILGYCNSPCAVSRSVAITAVDTIAAAMR